jgi:hypothetical protein
MAKTNWLWVGAGIVAASSIPATFGVDASVALPLSVALLGKGFGVF